MMKVRKLSMLIMVLVIWSSAALAQSSLSARSAAEKATLQEEEVTVIVDQAADQLNEKLSADELQKMIENGVIDKSALKDGKLTEEAIEAIMIAQEEGYMAPLPNEASGTNKVLFDPVKAQWDLLESFDVQTPINETGCLGAEFDGTSYWVTARGQNAANHVVAQFDLSGNLLNSYPHVSSSAWGIRDLAYDGTYLYGGDDLGFYQIDPATGTITTTWASPPANFPRAVAYIPTIGQFICGNFGNDWYTFNADGTGQTPITNPGLSGVYGMAYDSWNDVVWVFDQSGTPQTTIYEYDYNTNTLTGVSYQVPLIGASTDQLAGGLWYAENHPNYPGYGVIGGLTQGTPLDLHFVLELNNTADPNAPDAPTGLTGTPGGGGALEATIDWTNPTLEVDGDPLTDLTSIELSRDGTVIYTDNSPVIGGADSYFDNAVPAAGQYTYSVVGYNSAGMGIPASVDVYVATCAAPTGLAANGITGTTADLSWTDNAGASSWDIEVVLAGDPPTGTPTAAGVTNPYTVTGLSTQTDYDWYVRANCPSGGNSDWSGPATFTTACGTFTPPVVESFDVQADPNCWTNTSSDPVSNGLWEYGNATTNSPGYGASGTPDHTGNGGFYAWSDGSSPQVADITLMSPPIDASGLSTPYLEFYVFSNNVDYPGDNVPLYVDFWDGAAWNNVTVYAADDPNWVLVGLDLSAYTITGPVQFRFITDQTVTTNYAWYNDILIDDIFFGEMPTCPTPTGLNAINITGTTADLVWTSNSGLSNVEWGLDGFAQGSGTMVNGTTSPLGLTGLTPLTAYDFYVQDDCGANGLSMWAGPYSFTTSISADVIIGSGTATGEHLPIEPFYGYSYTQTIYDAAGFGTPGSGMQIEKIYYNYSWNGGDDDSDDWTVYMGTTTETNLDAGYLDISGFAQVFSGDVDLELVSGDGWLEITLDVGFPYDPATDGNLVIAVDENMPSYTSSTDEFYCDQTTDNVSRWYYSDGTNPDPSAPPAGTVSNYYPNTAFDFGAVPACPPPYGLSATVYSDAADLMWNSYSGLSNIEWGLQGFSLGSGTMVNGVTSPYSLTGLTPNTAYDFYVQDDCGANGTSTWAGPYTFTTLFADLTVPYSFGFETGDKGAWNDATADFVWEVNSGSTVSSGTGPSSAYEGTYYVYTESSSPNYPTMTAGLFATFDFLSSGVGGVTFDFAYHMYGAAMGTLELQVSTDGGTTWNTEWSMSGDQGDAWYEASVGLSTYAGMDDVIVRFWGTTGTSYTSDMAVDDINVYEPLDHDVGTVSIDVAGFLGVGAFDPMATVENFGTNTETFDVNMTISGGYSSTKTVTGLAPGASQQVTFDSWNPTPGSYTIDVCTQLATDQDNTNDCMSANTDVYDLEDKVVYGYNAYDPTSAIPVGPVWFNLLQPGTINSIADQSAEQPSFAGTWADGVWYNAIYTDNTLVTIDPATGARTVIGSLGVGINGLAYDAVADVLYGIDYDAGVPGQSGLYTIDMATGATTLIGGTTGGELLINLASPSTGGLYSVDLGADVFGSIDPATGVFTPIGPIGFDANYAQDMEFDRDNDACFLAGYNNAGGGELRVANMTTGATTLIGTFENDMEMCGFAIPYSGGTDVSITAILEGPYDDASDMMMVDLNTGNVIPDDQPYNAAPWNYAGTESVSGMPSVDIVDWVLVELRETATNDPATATGGTMIAQRAGFLLSDGSIVDVDGTSPLNFDVQVNDYLFAVVWHRNHLAVMSNFALTETGGVYTYDFTSDVNQAYGGSLAHKEIETGVWGLVAADGDADGQVSNTDKNVVWNSQSGSGGYLMGDFNLDVQVDNVDKNIYWYPNGGSGSGVPDSAIPAGGYNSQVPK